MTNVINHLKTSKITTSAAAIMAVLSVLEIEGDPQTVYAIRTLLEANIDTVAHLGAIILLLFAKDPGTGSTPQDPKE